MASTNFVEIFVVSNKFNSRWRIVLDSMPNSVKLLFSENWVKALLGPSLSS